MKPIPNSNSQQTPSGGLSLRAAAGFVALIGVGFFLGNVLPKSGSDAAATSQPPGRPAPRSASEAPPPLVTIRSTDTIEDLLAAEPATLYERLALWLVDATSDEMAAYWQATKSLENYPRDARELLLQRWTIIDPHAAIAATVGTAWDDVAWSAWASHEPLKALEAARERGGSVLNSTLMAIGLTDPQLALTILKEHPEFAGYWSVYGLINGLTRTDPAAAMEFAALQPDVLNDHLLEQWFRHDPHATLAWLLAKGDDLNVFGFFNATRSRFLEDALKDAKPELLRELAAQCPPGELRQRIETRLFEQKLENDPEAALAEARANPSPVGAAEQLAKVALHEARTHPEKSLELLDEIFRRSPWFPEYPGLAPDGKGTGESLLEARSGDELIRTLAESQPEALMDSLTKHGKGVRDSGHFKAAMVTWLHKDPASVAEWAARQEPENSAAICQFAAVILGGEGGETTMEFAIKSGDEETIRRGLMFWNMEDPDGAARWAEANGMSIEQR